MGHIAPVNSVDFASGNSDYLVTSGRDRAVKIWQWRSKTVKLNIDLRKCGRGTGLLKFRYFEKATKFEKIFYLTFDATE